MPATLLHSDLTLAIATMASSRVNRQLKAKLSNFSSKGYEGTSGWKPKAEKKTDLYVKKEQQHNKYKLAI